MLFAYIIFLSKSCEKNLLGTLCVDGTIILQFMLKELVVRMLTGSVGSKC
jgi:hypothetical protein